MSRIGKLPIALPPGVRAQVDGRRIRVEGPRGALDWGFPRRVDIAVDEAQIRITRRRDDKPSRAEHGLVRALVHNMVAGVTQGFVRKLEIVGLGYQARVQGQKLVLQIGFSHPVEIDIPAGLEVVCPDPTHITVTGIDKQRVGQLAADIRRVRKPEPYKGKGIRFEGEFVRRKAGKAFVGGGG
ncbi:MAG: 50S ribosomal protein L6 [Planctomycetes bacterium]|nr:50S ribosomal protein L6 [Planctomycetota bacterium]